METFKSGFTAVLGRPNVGKSTLVNALLGEKVSITSFKPQTTRNNITGILNGDAYQVVFIDTPGIHSPKTKLGEFMARSVETAKNDVDLTLFLVAANPGAKINDKDADIIKRLVAANGRLVIVVNKIDTCEKPQVLGEIAKYAAIVGEETEIVPLSALKAENIDELKRLIIAKMPEGDAFYPDDMFTTQTQRQMAAEIIREKALLLLRDEIPHGIAVEITDMKKRPQPTKNQEIIFNVDATVFCEKDSHKGMIIGKNGAMLKKIGESARPAIERLLDGKVFLTLWVKVKDNWRDDPVLVKDFGYNYKEL